MNQSIMLIGEAWSFIYLEALPLFPEPTSWEARDTDH